MITKHIKTNFCQDGGCLEAWWNWFALWCWIFAWDWGAALTTTSTTTTPADAGEVVVTHGGKGWGRHTSASRALQATSLRSCQTHHETRRVHFRPGRHCELSIHRCKCCRWAAVALLLDACGGGCQVTNPRKLGHGIHVGDHCDPQWLSDLFDKSLVVVRCC